MKRDVDDKIESEADRKQREFLEKMEEIERAMTIQARTSELNRARSVTVGTAFGGVTELTMRANDGKTVFAIMQPVETIELIHQLAGNVGCHLALKPREDFAAWRAWEADETKALGSFPPHPNDLAALGGVGASLPDYSDQPGIPREQVKGVEHKDKLALTSSVEALEQRIKQLQLELKSETSDTENKEKLDAVAAKKHGNKRSTKRSGSSS